MSDSDPRAILEQFEYALDSCLEGYGCRVVRIRPGANCFEVRSADLERVLFRLDVHVSHGVRGWWGFQKVTIDFFDEAVMRAPWGLVFIHHAADTGYFVDEALAKENIRSGRWSESLHPVNRKIEYKVNRWTLSDVHSGDLAPKLAELILQAVAQEMVPPGAIFPDEMDTDADQIVAEGALRQVTVNYYERDPTAWAACIRRYGPRCAVCEISFEERYGQIGRGFIHVHHKNPLALRRAKFRLNPLTDLVPVCPNCHAMLHTQSPPLAVDELRALIDERRRT